MSKKKYKLEDLPVYEIVIDDFDETGIRYLSIVQDPAIETKGMFFNGQEVKEFRFFANKEQQKIVGPALIPYKKIYRCDEDGEYFVMFTPETIQKMVRKFNSIGTNRRVNYNHSNVMVDGYIEQNWIIYDSIYDKSKVYGYDLPKDTWFVEVKIDDSNFWNTYVKEDGFCSFSIEGIMGQKLVSMTSHMDEIIDSLSDEEIIGLYNEFVVEKKPGETKDEFIGRCIGIEINDGRDPSQAAAICYSKWESMAAEKVSFDFDDTLTREDIQNIASKLISDGVDVYIISARQSKDGIYPIADKLGINHSNIFATGSNKAKIEKVKELGISKHYDNNQDVIDGLPGIGKKV